MAYSLPSVLVSSRNTSEARSSLFPVCGLCLWNVVLSFTIQLGFPMSVPITKHPKDRSHHSQNPEQLGARSCPALCGFGLIFSSGISGSFLSPFFFLYKWGESVQCGGSFIGRSLSSGSVVWLLLAEWSLGAVEGRQEAEGSWCLPSVFRLRYESSANFGFVSSGSFPGR